MKLLIPFPYYREGSGGVANFITYFSKEASRQGQDVTIVSTLKEGETSLEHNGKITVIRLPVPQRHFLRRLRDYPTFGRAVRSAIASGVIPEPDAVFGISFAACAGIGRRLIYRSAAGPIAWERQMWRDLRHKGWVKTGCVKRFAMMLDFSLQQRLEGKCVRNAEKIVCHSSAVAEGYRQEYGITVPVHIPCTGVDTVMFCPRPVKKGRDPILFFSGGFSIQKGAKAFEEALPSIISRYPTVRLIIAGDPLYRLPQALADHVTYLGHVDHTTLASYYNKADVFVFPTIQNEGFPNSVLEAMASGSPIVMTAIPGIEEYLEHGVSALLIPKYDSSALTDSICRILGDKKLGARLGKGARIASMRFAWPKLTRSILSFIGERKQQ